MKHVQNIEGAPAVTVAWRAPFALGPTNVAPVEVGRTIAEIIAALEGLPDDFGRRGVVCINGEEVDRRYWRRVRPKIGTVERPVSLTLHWPPRGGGGGRGAGKTAITLVAAIALAAVTAGIGSGAILAGTSAAIGSALGTSAAVGAAILSASVGIAGSLAIAALSPPPAVTRQRSSQETALGPASISGNVIGRGTPLPRVVGTSKVYPPLAGSPVIELVDEDEYAEAAFVLAGPHYLEDIRVGEAQIEDTEDVQYEVYEGWQDDPAVGLCRRQGFLDNPGVELSTQLVDPDNQSRLKYPSDPARCLPVWHGLATRPSPDEVWIHFLLPAGLGENGDPTDDKCVPLRLQIRRRGSSTWINLPEIHLSGRQLAQIRRAVLLKWAGEPETIPAVPIRSGWVAAYKSVPGQVGLGSTGPWVANAYFSGGAGADGLYSGVEGSTNVRHTYLYANRVEFYLDAGTFPKGIYEIRIKRGAPYDASTLNKATYEYSGTVRDFFGHLSGAIPMTRENIADQMYIARFQSIWNEELLPKRGQSVIAVKVRNRTVDSLSVLASGYVRDWDGTGWDDWVTTSNPAPHYRDVMIGRQNLDPIPEDLIDDAGLVAWRQRCSDDGLTCDAVFEGASIAEVLDIIASCGYARRYQADLWGVIEDYDRSAETPVQLFSSRNAWNIRWERGFPRLPDGLRVSWRDALAAFAEAETIVYRDEGGVGQGGRFEAIAYQGLIEEEAVVRRARFDLRQADLRSTFYSFDCPPLALVARRGDLIALQHDTLHRQTGTARVVRKILSSDDSEIVGLELDSTITAGESGTTWWGMTDFWNNK